MPLLPFGGVPPKTNVAGSGIVVNNSGGTSTIGIIPGGTAGQVLQTNGSGVLSWAGSATSPAGIK